jgi:single-stranded-DNA-specific exonuclease
MFNEILTKRGFDWVLEQPSQTFPNFQSEEYVLNALVDVCRNDKTILVYGDYDADGAMARCTAVDVLRYLGVKNILIHPYRKRTHDVDPIAVNMAVKKQVDYFLVCDAGSSSPDTFKWVQMYGVKPILLDHHETVYGYKDFEGTAMLNTSIENRTRDKDVSVSAGALTYIIFYKLCIRLGVPPLKSTAAYALASLYADSIDMSGDVQRLIYQQVQELSDSDIPPLLQRFMVGVDKQSQLWVPKRREFTRRFIEFTVNPRINALIRAERFDLLNSLLEWTPNSHWDMSELISEVFNHHRFIREQVSLAADLITKEKHRKSVVVGNLSSVAGRVKIPADKLNNYTGQVANDLAGRFGKAAVVICDASTHIKGSVRDHNSRDYLSLFSLFCDAGGHKSAFGFQFPYLEYSAFYEYLDVLDKSDIKSLSNDPIIVPHNFEEPSPEEVVLMARYNEFAGNQVPFAYFRRVWMKVGSYSKIGDEISYPWGDFRVATANSSYIRPGSTLTMQPFKHNRYGRNRGVKMMVKTGVLR